MRSTVWTGRSGIVRRIGRVSAYIGLALFVLAIWSSAALAQTRIVAVGDVHGDLGALTSILRAADVIDENNRWTGGTTILVQVGDMLDRGLRGKEVMDLYMALEQQAPQSGGRVEVVLGNHEVMNMMGDWRYVTNMTPFADAESDARRKAAYDAYTAWRKQRASVLGKPAPTMTPEMEQEWMSAHLRGYVERMEALGPDAAYGAWLRTRPAVLRIDDTIFVHGGISPDVAAAMSLDEINAQIKQEIALFDAYKQTLVEQGIVLPFMTQEEMTAAARAERKRLEGKNSLSASEAEALEAIKSFSGNNGWLSMREDGPLWFRGFEEWSDTEGPEQIARLREAYGDVRFVVGHSVTPDKRIQARFDHAAFMIDTGMLSMYYRGRPSVLELQYGGAAAIYTDSRETLVEPTEAPPPQSSQMDAASAPVETPRLWWGPDGQPLPFRTDEEIMAFMRDAEVVSMERIGTGVTNPHKILLEKDGVRMHAIFRDVSKVYPPGDIDIQEVRDDCVFECAAYVMSRLLGLNNVPPVVERRVKGKEGTVQIWLEHSMMEEDRRKRKIAPFDPTRWAQDWQIVEMFDNLIYNSDRNSGNILIDQMFTVWMIDHTRAFRQYSVLRDTHAKYLKQIERGVWEKLQTVDDETIKKELTPYLRGYEIDALLKRRQKLMAYIQGLIDKQGEDVVLFSWQ